MCVCVCDFFDYGLGIRDKMIFGIILVSLTVLWINEASRGHLSTFTSDTIRVHLPRSGGSVFDEAFSLMRANFINRGLYNSSDWDAMYQKYSRYQTEAFSHTRAIRTFLRSFKDPYTLYFEPTTMDRKNEAFRGERRSAGVILERCFSAQKLRLGLLHRWGILGGVHDDGQGLGLGSGLGFITDTGAGDDANVGVVAMRRERGTAMSLVFPPVSIVSRLCRGVLATSGAAAAVALRMTKAGSDSIAMPHFLKKRLSRTNPMLQHRVALALVAGAVAVEAWVAVAHLYSMGSTLRVASLEGGGDEGEGQEQARARARVHKSSGVRVGDELVAIENVCVEGMRSQRATRLLEEAMAASGCMDGGVDITVRREIDHEIKGGRANCSQFKVSGNMQADSRFNLHTATLLPVTHAIEGCVSFSHLSSGPRYVNIQAFSDRTPGEVEQALLALWRAETSPGFNREKKHGDETEISADAGTSASETNRSLGFGRLLRDALLGGLWRERRQLSSSWRNYDQGLVLDLRGNLGGTLPAALDVACMFLPKGTCVLELLGADKGAERGKRRGQWRWGRGGQEEDREERGTQVKRDVLSSTVPHLQGKGRLRSERHYSINTQADCGTPILVLVDGSTASASEVLTVALTAHCRAVSAGTCTLGKDVAQAVIGLSDGSGLALTVRRYCDPRGLDLGGGIRPQLDLSWADTVRCDKIRLIHAKTADAANALREATSEDAQDKLYRELETRGFVWFVEDLPVFATSP